MLPSSSNSASGPLKIVAFLQDPDLNNVGDLEPTSGAIAVNSSKQEISATFDMQLETSDHQVVSLTKGSAAADQCQRYQQDAYCMYSD